MPHCRPMMNTRPQITSVEEMIRIPDLAQGLAEELQDAPGEDLAHDARREAAEVPGGFDPAAHRITGISGWVASSVWVKT